MKFKGKITHLSQKGLGVVKNDQNNLTYFVYGTWPGDIGEFEVIDKMLNNKKFAYAKLLQLIQPSLQRQAVLCSHAKLMDDGCTGCPWMIADYTSQLEQKRNRFVYAMQRSGFDVSTLTINDVHPAPQQYGYRNRCQLKTDGKTLGFISETSHQMIPIQDCMVLNDACRNLLQTALEQLPHADWQMHHNVDHWNTIDLDDEMQPESIRINQKRLFKQGNTHQNERIQNWLREKLEQHPKPGMAVELFCGSGNLTAIIAASHCTSIMAYESDAEAIQLLNNKHLPKVNAFTADLFNASIWTKLHKDVRNAEILVLDPPRAGLKKHRGFFECFSSLQTIYYISCNPETFARDTYFFKHNNWSIKDIQLIDLFPHTPHVEILAEIVKDIPSTK